MRVILNYKSLYEAVKVGVTNDGYTPVTRMLFSIPREISNRAMRTASPMQLTPRTLMHGVREKITFLLISKQLSARNPRWNPSSSITNQRLLRIICTRLPKMKCMKQW